MINPRFLLPLSIHISGLIVKIWGFCQSVYVENISELQAVLEIKKGDILAIRSLKNLKQEAKHRRLHRKIAHF